MKGRMGEAGAAGFGVSRGGVLPAAHLFLFLFSFYSSNNNKNPWPPSFWSMFVLFVVHFKYKY